MFFLFSYFIFMDLVKLLIVIFICVKTLLELKHFMHEFCFLLYPFFTLKSISNIWLYLLLITTSFLYFIQNYDYQSFQLNYKNLWFLSNPNKISHSLKYGPNSAFHCFQKSKNPTLLMYWNTIDITHTVPITFWKFGRQPTSHLSVKY